MAYREVPRMEIKEIIRRWQAGESPRQIAAGTGLSRNTVRKYLAAARLQGITQGGPATISQAGPRRPKCLLIVEYAFDCMKNPPC